MPKSLGWFLHGHALHWQIPGQAVHVDHGRGWHRYDGELPGWTHCNIWVSDAWVIEMVGRGHRRQSPWDGSGHLVLNALCESCFEHELPLLWSLERIMYEEREGLSVLPAHNNQEDA